MGSIGPEGFFLFLMALLTTLGLYATYRMTQRAAPAVEATGSYTTMIPTATPVAMEVAQEVFIEAVEEAAAEAVEEQLAEGQDNRPA